MSLNLSSFLQWRCNIIMCKILGLRITFYYISILEKLYFFFNKKENWQIKKAVNAVFGDHKHPLEIYDLALYLPDVVFDDDGVFGQNIVRQPSKNFDFDTVLFYMREIYNLSNPTSELQDTLLNIMPFFRLPAHALKDDLIPNTCFRGEDRQIFSIQSKSLAAFRPLTPKLTDKYANLMSEQRSVRDLVF